MACNPMYAKKVNDDQKKKEDAKRKKRAREVEEERRQVVRKNANAERWEQIPIIYGRAYPDAGYPRKPIGYERQHR